jgi:hypothetical protein
MDLFFILYGILAVFFLKDVALMLFTIAFSMVNFFILSVVLNQFLYQLEKINNILYLVNESVAIVFIFYGLYLVKNENNIYLDDINVYSININPNLRAKGFMVTPNPTTGIIAVQLYPNPATLKGISIYNSAGQKVAEQLVNGGVSTSYPFNLGHFANGIYIVKVIFSDKTYLRKVVKQ